MITIVDYGVGNSTSVQKACEFLGASVRISSQKTDIEKADILIVPGQGACGQAMSQLKEKNLIDPIKAHIVNGKPFLGVCLGFQILFEFSDEDGGVPCLGVFPGRVEKFQLPHLKVPHMGWNTIDVQPQHSDALHPLTTGQHVYFVHSFYVGTTEPENIATQTTYGIPFVSSVRKQNVWGTQFHPEKSGDVGLSYLSAFLKGRN